MGCTTSKADDENLQKTSTRVGGLLGPLKVVINNMPRWSDCCAANETNFFTTEETSSCMSNVLMCSFDCCDLKIPSYLFEMKDQFPLGGLKDIGIARGSFTFSFFLKLNSLQNQSIFHQKVNEAGDSFTIGVYQSRIFVSHGMEGYYLIAPQKEPLKVDVYGHHAFVLDQYTGTYSYYFNGTHEAVIYNALPFNKLNNNSPLYVGSTFSPNLETFNGTVSLVRCHHSALNKEEIVAIAKNKYDRSGLIALDGHYRNYVDHSHPLNRDVYVCCSGCCSDCSQHDCVVETCGHVGLYATCRFGCIDVKIPSFNFGRTDQFQIGHLGDLGVNGGTYSISFFLKLDSLKDQIIFQQMKVVQKFIAARQGGSGLENFFRVGLSNRKLWLAHDNALYKFTSPTEVEMGLYYHHAFSFSKSHRLFSYYRNGALQAELIVSDPPTIENSYPLHVGGPTGSNKFESFSGSISQLRIHGTHLDNDDVVLFSKNKFNFEGILKQLEQYPKIVYDEDHPMNKDTHCCCLGPAYNAGAKCIE